MIKDFFLLAIGAFFYTVACPPYDWSAAGWVALTPFFLVLRHATVWMALWAGLVFGVLCCAGIGYWIYLATVQYFALSFPFDILLTLLNYSFFAGVYCVLAAVAMRVLLQKGHRWIRVIGAPATWVASEFARGYGPAGIPWELLGYTQYRHLPLIQIADLTGVYGLSFLLALSSYAAAEICVFFLSRSAGWETAGQPSSSSLKSYLATVEAQSTNQSAIRNPQSAIVRFPWLAITLVVISLLFTFLYGTLQLQQYSVPAPSSAPAVTIAVVQGNVPGTQRWQRTQQASTLMRYVAVSQHGITDHHPELIVWPEFALGFYLDQEPILQAQLGRFTTMSNAALLVGAPRRETSDTAVQVFNSAYLLSPDGEILATYDKQRLIPFAEYLPPAFSLLRSHRPEGPNDFTPGTQATIFSLPRAQFGALICYEVIYPYLVHTLVQNGAQFLVNLSNDVWGASEGAAAQHFSMTIFRAVEYRRFLVRAATAGVSGFVDPTGRAYGLMAGPEGVSIGTVLPRQEFTVYARFGDWFALVCALTVCSALLLCTHEL